MNEADQKLKGDRGAPAAKPGMNRSQDIFGDSKPTRVSNEPNEEAKAFAEKVENKRRAEDSRYRGNEYMKSKDYEEAINEYSRSIDLNPGEAATYCNRAMAHLKMKNWPRVIDDANKTLELQPDYVKAYHRRGKAYLATNKFELAIKDF